MGTLSDTEIRERIAAGGLIIGGNPDQADASSYEFRAGVIVPTGDAAVESILDWTSVGTATDLYWVKPGELVWVRTRETVAIPDDICAFWWQTHRLSRQGLMLVNMTMVEPGYEGPLACLFANFGRQNVLIDRDTIVARLVFFDLNRPAAKPFRSSKTAVQYDRSLVESARTAPRQFLDLETLSRDVKQQVDEALAHLEHRKRDLATELSNEAHAARKAASEGFASDTKNTMLKAFPVAIVALALLAGAVSFVPWVQGQISPDLGTEVRKQVDETLDKRLDAATVPDEVATLRAEMAELRKQLDSIGASPAPNP